MIDEAWPAPGNGDEHRTGQRGQQTHLEDADYQSELTRHTLDPVQEGRRRRRGVFFSADEVMLTDGSTARRSVSSIK